MKFFILTFCLWLPSLGIAEPVVSNVRAAQRAGTKLVDVYYDLSGATGPATVVVAVSNDGGGSYAVSASSFSGAVGGGVANGTNKQVVWNAGADWNEQFSAAVKFRITASEPPPVPADFALIPAGSFQMGDSFTEGWADEQPVHSVQVSAFFMGKYEVTKALWDDVRIWGAANGYTDLPVGGGKAANHPVQTISWYDMVKWCNARSQKEGLTPCYTVSGVTYMTGSRDDVVCDWAASGYRLPSEAEWEKAARGGLSGQRFPWGATITHSQANYSSSSSFSYDTSPTGGNHPTYGTGSTPYTAPVGSFAANGYGLHDMAGNVWERCWDWYGFSYYASSPASDPRGTAWGLYRAVRGGSWNTSASSCRAAARNPGFIPGGAYYFFGFRLARSSVP